ncbi:hypothetical protein BDZ89DRAFT_1040019 [Hymenopellis radicata]|nr:hypothetical protein BDZ89DRAFT_1040019 [Hymenopellis radicata]
MTSCCATVSTSPTVTGHHPLLSVTTALIKQVRTRTIARTSGAATVRIVRFFIHDGDQTKDFIKALGLSFNVPLTDKLQDRQGGVWGEAVRTVSGLRRNASAAVLVPQLEGQATPALSAWLSTVSAGIDDLPVWSDFTLDQLSPAHYAIKKRSARGRDASFIGHAGFGDKAAGVGYSATGGGALFGLRDT